MQLPERTERSVSYTRVSAPGRLRGKSGEGEFVLYSILQKHLFRNICLDVYRHNQLMAWQRINKLTPERSTKSNDQSCAKENASQV